MDVNGGAVSGAATLLRQERTASFKTSLQADGVVLNLPWSSGRLSGRIDLAGAGISPATLIASMGGKGVVRLADGEIARADVGAPLRVAKAVEAEEIVLDPKVIEAALARAFDAGPQRLPSFERAISLAGGQGAMSPVDLAVGTTRVRLGLRYDLSSDRVELQEEMRPTPPDDWTGAPAYSRTDAERSIPCARAHDRRHRSHRHTRIAWDRARAGADRRDRSRPARTHLLQSAAEIRSRFGGATQGRGGACGSGAAGGHQTRGSATGGAQARGCPPGGVATRGATTGAGAEGATRPRGRDAGRNHTAGCASALGDDASGKRAEHHRARSRYGRTVLAFAERSCSHMLARCFASPAMPTISIETTSQVPMYFRYRSRIAGWGHFAKRELEKINSANFSSNPFSTSTPANNFAVCWRKYSRNPNIHSAAITDVAPTSMGPLLSPCTTMDFRKLGHRPTTLQARTSRQTRLWRSTLLRS